MENRNGALWVFGYGSLIWDPGFAYEEKTLAVLRGYRRAFCMTSIHYRGTAEDPGLVLALDEDGQGACEGVIYRVADEVADAVLEYLRERELISYAYDEAWLDVEAGDGRVLRAVTYVMNRDHDQYAGALDLASQAAIIARTAGTRGPNADYLMNTVASLEALGIHDAELHELAGMVRGSAGG
ncbi:gamma-glutamylcyclotransferase [Amaricoccus tamworthensis]|uniref:gamma-glutamylcyclotransferase n=1 Tax=Amaricoccus tamworthensis TaxID=57002 RepID=UPI003C7DCA92